eukprot:TRINITY_DN6024_c0_g1_i2.p2 TRINITY_DN6024_c0_g1~~TRINITY_DN6024_c0_g1_i2.p2  ORF type:complete len:281 (+),score=66.89 TRINITY_DN6024_c0_g1_i2:76-918(+)
MSDLVTDPREGQVRVELAEMFLSESGRCPLLYIVAEVLQSVAQAGDSAAEQSPPRVTPYDIADPAGRDLHRLVRRWARGSRCGAAAIVAAVVLFDRLCRRTGLKANSVNVIGLFTAALLVSTKCIADEVCTNSGFARLCGLLPEEVSHLERQLIKDLDWDVAVSEEDLWLYATAFRHHTKWDAAVEMQASEAPKPSRSGLLRALWTPSPPSSCPPSRRPCGERVRARAPSSGPSSAPSHALRSSLPAALEPTPPSRPASHPGRSVRVRIELAGKHAARAF